MAHETGELLKRVGLSYTANLAASDERLHVKRYATGEVNIRKVSTFKPNLTEVTGRLSVQSGERVQSGGITQRGKRRIRQAAQFYQMQVDEKETKKAYSSFITLTYGKAFPKDHKVAKRDLEAFIKRMKRHLGGGSFHYCWVAELQKRGAIHFHILTPEYIEKEAINAGWNGVVNGRFAKEGNDQVIQTLYPHVEAVYHAAGYMTKYLSKEGERIIGNGYFVSHKTSKAIKPVFEDTFNIAPEKVEEIFEVLDNLNKETSAYFDFENSAIRLKWFADLPEHHFYELIEYHLSEFTSSLRGGKSKDLIFESCHT